MHSAFLASLLSLLIAAPLEAGAQTASKPALAQEAMIALPNTKGRIDHLTVDLARNHLFVAELGNNTVDVVDLVTRKVVHRIEGLDEPQGVAYEPKADLLAVAGGGDGTLRLFSARDFSPRAVIKLGEDADNVRVDPRTGLFVVGYGSGALAVIDGQKGIKLREVPLPGHPESFRLSGNRVFVNVPGAGKVVVADIDSGKVSATWTPERLSGQFPMFLDDAGHVGIVFRGGNRLVLFDGATGKQVSSVPTCGDADDLFYDAKRKAFYVSCGSGGVDVFNTGNGGMTLRSHVSTALGARTSYFVPELDRLFVAERATVLLSNAAIAVLKPAD